MHPIIWTIILSILPVSELRGGIPYAILNEINPISHSYIKPVIIFKPS